MLLILQEIYIGCDLITIHSLYKNHTAYVKKGETTVITQIKKIVRQESLSLLKLLLQNVINIVIVKLQKTKHCNFN